MAKKDYTVTSYVCFLDETGKTKEIIPMDSLQGRDREIIAARIQKQAMQAYLGSGYKVSAKLPDGTVI